MQPSTEELLPYQKDLAGAAKKFDVAERTIRRWLKAADIYMPKENYRPNKLSPETKSEIIRLYAAGGITQEQLARRFEISQSRVGAILTESKNASDLAEEPQPKSE